MAKYSTGDSSSSGGSTDDGFCELCGEESSYLHKVTISGAKLNVCNSCSDSDDSKKNKTDSASSKSGSPGKKSTKELIRESTGSGDPDSSWAEKGMNYNDTPLPYLRDSYGSQALEAREEEGLSVEELADEISVEPEEIKSVENNSATSDDVSGVVIERLEEYLDIRLSESV